MFLCVVSNYEVIIWYENQIIQNMVEFVIETLKLNVVYILLPQRWPLVYIIIINHIYKYLKNKSFISSIMVAS